MKRKLGYMSPELHQVILDKYAAKMESYKINSLQEEKRYPYINYAGLGEPLLHSEVFSFIRFARQMEFETILITNGSMLTAEKREKLVGSGLSHLFISFWGIKREEYETLMGLDYHKSLENVIETIKLSKSTPMKIQILWVHLPQISSTPGQVKQFWAQYGVDVDMEDLKPWNKGGYIKEKSLLSTFRQFPPTDYEKSLWCSELAFITSICYDGRVVLCSADYVEGMGCPYLGNIRDNTLDTIAGNKARIIKEKTKFPICSACRMPRSETCRYIWDSLLSNQERKEYSYD